MQTEDPETGKKFNETDITTNANVFVYSLRVPVLYQGRWVRHHLCSLDFSAVSSPRESTALG
jgi:hypothetical protein